MDNKDLPAMPTGLVDEEVLNADGEYCGTVEAKYTGLTKREHFCLKMGVPKTGDPELDEIINEGNKIKLAGLAMQGWLARCANAPHSHKLEPEDMARVAVEMADALLVQPDKGE